MLADVKQQENVALQLAEINIDWEPIKSKGKWFIETEEDWGYEMYLGLMKFEAHSNMILSTRVIGSMVDTQPVVDILR